MKRQKSCFIRDLAMLALFGCAICAVSEAQNSSFHNAPASAKEAKNPYAGENRAAEIGGQIYAVNCAKCHGGQGQGTGNIPALKEGPAQAASEGELFWFVTQGDAANGMPAWASLSEQGRWQIVAYMKAGLPAIPRGVNSPELDATVPSAAAPKTPFTDFRFEKPGTIRKITFRIFPRRLPRNLREMPPNWLPDLKTHGRKPPPVLRWICTQPGSINRASSARPPMAITSSPKAMPAISKCSAASAAIPSPQQVEVFASGLNRPYGIAFYPPGPNPQWVYIGEHGLRRAVSLPERRLEGARPGGTPRATCPSAAATGPAASNSRRTARRCSSQWVRLPTSTIPTYRRRKKSRGYSGIHAGRLGNAYLCFRNPQCGRRTCDRSQDRRIVVFGE